MVKDPKIPAESSAKTTRKLRLLTAYLAAAVFGLTLVGITVWMIWGSLGNGTSRDNPDQLAVETKPPDNATVAKRLSDLSSIPNAQGGDGIASGGKYTSAGEHWNVENINNLSPNPVDLPAPIRLDFSKAVSLSDIPIPSTINLDMDRSDQQSNSSPDAGSFDEYIRLKNLRQYIVSMCVDLQGNVWIGTENNGIQRFTPGAPKWQQWKEYRAADGLGDDSCYALACDQQGRVWAGHVNHGVSVFNGLKWQNYDVVGGVSRSDSLSGPLGERVFAIKVCPTDGDVWIATNAGLARYSERLKQWCYYTKADGMPSDLANAIAFDQQGNIYLASQCDGIIMADAADDYHAWRSVSGPDELPQGPTGTGLPTGMMNDVLVAHNGTVYAATTTGLAWSIDQGKSWRYVRGTDWADKARGSIQGVPADWNPAPGALLAEDYVVCLGEDPLGYLYVGSRNSGWKRFVEGSDGSLGVADKGGSGYVSAFPPILDRVHLGATYGGGMISIEGNSRDDLGKFPPTTSIASLPVGATPPNSNDLQKMLDDLSAVPPLTDADSPKAIALDDDWRTRGAWLGRYGRYWAVIPSIDAYSDYVWGAGPETVPFVIKIGAHHEAGDSLRHWIGVLYTDDPRIPEIPPVYMDSRLKHGYAASPKANRRLGQWDDHGEGYAITHEGPDLFTTIGIPNGTFILSVYEINDNAQSVPDRDFEIVVKPHSDINFSDLSQFDQRPVLATARVLNFWSGVYKRFLVQGPAALTLNVRRQYSLNANISGVMLDLPDERPAPYFKPFAAWQKERAEKTQQMAARLAAWNDGVSQTANDFGPDSPSEQQVEQIARKLDDLLQWNPRWWAVHHQELSVILARWCSVNHAQNSEQACSSLLKGHCFYEVGLFNAWESCLEAQKVASARQIETSLRWDGITPAYSGRGFDTVTKYLASVQRSR